MIKIGYSYFNFLVDDFGIWQHSSGLSIDKQHGYALDDSARALLLATRIGDRVKAKILLDNVILCFSENGSNFYDENRKPLGIEITEDACGEALWGLAEFNHNEGGGAAEGILKQRFEMARSFRSIRGWAYVTVAASVFDREITIYFAEKILLEYDLNKTKDWNWPEKKLTYANAVMPMALLKAYTKVGDIRYLKAGVEMLDFLNKRAKTAKQPIAIGNEGWYRRGSRKALYGQQPIDIAYQTIANIVAYEILAEQRYLDEAKNYYSWFWGNNIENVKMIDIQNMRCLDGFGKDFVSNNCGAESIICFLLSQEEIWPYLTGDRK